MAEKTQSVAFPDHCSGLGDPRQAGKVLYPLREMLLLVLCAVSAGADGFVEIALWGREHLDFLRAVRARHPQPRRAQRPVQRARPRGLSRRLHRLDREPARRRPGGSRRLPRPDRRQACPREGGGQDVQAHRRRRQGPCRPAPGLGLGLGAAPRHRPGGRRRQGERDRRHPPPVGDAGAEGQASKRRIFHGRHDPRRPCPTLPLDR